MFTLPVQITSSPWRNDFEVYIKEDAEGILLALRCSSCICTSECFCTLSYDCFYGDEALYEIYIY